MTVNNKYNTAIIMEGRGSQFQIVLQKDLHGGTAKDVKARIRKHTHLTHKPGRKKERKPFTSHRAENIKVKGPIHSAVRI